VGGRYADLRIAHDGRIKPIWDGSATVRGNAIAEIRPINFWNPDKRIVCDGDHLEWEALITGDFGDFDLFLREPDAGKLELQTAHASVDLPIAEIGAGPTSRGAGGLARHLSVRCLPGSRVRVVSG
jgi:hypothetical protein